MRKLIKNIVIVFMLVSVTFAVTECLNPISFDPDQALATIRVTGELGVYDSNNAILWFLNCTKTVNVEKMTISVEEVHGYEVPEGYPHIYNGMPIHGQSLATYHKPANDRNQAVPYFYNVEIKFHDKLSYDNDEPVPDSSAEHKLEHKMQLPKPGETYKLYLVRMREGHIALVEEQIPPSETLDETDYIAAPEPTPAEIPMYPIIVRNRTQSATIDTVVFGNITLGNPVTTGDQYGYYMEANKYISYADYTVIGDPDEERSRGKTGNFNVEILKETNMTAQSIHLLYLDFYRTKNGQYKITQNWDADGPNGPNDLDTESLFHGNFDFANIRLTNNAADYIIYAVSAQRENKNAYKQHIGPEYIIDYPMFEPSGPIAHTNVKIAGFMQCPNDRVDFTIPYNWPFTINVYLQKRTMNEGDIKNFIVVPYPGWQIFPGKTVEIVVHPDDVKEGSGESEEQSASEFAGWRDDYHGWTARVNNTGGKVGAKNPWTTSIDIIFDDDPDLDDRKGLFGNGAFDIEAIKGEHGRAKIAGIARNANKGHGSYDTNGVWRDGNFNASTGANGQVKWTITLDVSISITGIVRLINKVQTAPGTPGDYEGRDVFIIGKYTPHTGGSGGKEIEDENGDTIKDKDGDPILVDDTDDITTEVTPTCENGSIGIPVTSVQIIGGNTIKPDGKWYSFTVQILPANATDKTLRWSKGILVDQDTVDFEWQPPSVTGNTGTLRVMMTSQFREKKDQLPKQANKLDMMVWADNCTNGVTMTSEAPNNYSVEEGILFVWGRDQNRMRSSTGFPSGFTAPLYGNQLNSTKSLTDPTRVNPPSLEEWNDLFKGNIDNPHNTNSRFTGRPFRQPKVTIKIDNK